MSADGGGGTPHGERLARLETDLGNVKNDVQALQTDVSGLKRFQAWIFGLGTGVGTIAGFMAQGIKDRFGLS